MSAEVSALRQLIAERFPDARPLGERDAGRIAAPVSTGVPALDVALPGGGLPRGKLTVWAPEGGAGAVLRATCRAVMAAGERAAWIDASGTMTLGWYRDSALGTRRSAGRRQLPSAECRVPSPELSPLVIHAGTRDAALRGAELLLRCGAFALVVLDGADPQGTETVRLTRATRDGGGAFVALTERTSMAALRIVSRLDVRGVRWRSGPWGDPSAPVDVRVEVRVRSLGWYAHTRVVLPIARYDLRQSLAPGRDRRGDPGIDPGDRRGPGGGR